MTDVVTLERIFPASAARVFEMVSQPQNMVRWWGHETMTVPEYNLDFTRTGPWFAVMEAPDGNRLQVSGEVTEVDPPRFIAFTWAWHEGGPGGPRGTDTRVTIEIDGLDATHAKITLSHYDLGTDPARASHTNGWLSVFRKLEKGLA